MAYADFNENQYTRDVWGYLVALFDGNEYGAAGMMANLYGESLCTPWRCQGWYGFGANVVAGCRNYYIQVDNGTITRDEFATYGWADNQTIDTTGTRDGYGLAQWTTKGRKEGLYDSKGTNSIADLTVQLNWLATELNTNYTSVLNVCKTATNYNEACDYVLDHYEIPLVKPYGQRRHYAEQIYNTYAGGISGYLTTFEIEGNGSASALPLRAESGDIVQITATPLGIDTFLGWTVLSGGVTLTITSTTTATFIMGSDNVHIKAEFSGTTPPIPPLPTKYKRHHMPIWMYPMFR